MAKTEEGTPTYVCIRLTLGSLQSLLFLRQSLSLNLKLTDPTTLAGQQTLHIFLFLHIQRWYAHTTVPDFNIGTGDQNQVLLLVQQVLID